MPDRRLGAVALAVVLTTGVFLMVARFNAGSIGFAVTDPAWSSLPPAASDGPRIAELAARGEFVAHCGFSHRALDDPIVHPNRPGRSHSHDFFGNETTADDSTPATLVGRETTCDKPGDTAAYWVPTLYRGREAVTPEVASAYYRGPLGADVTTLVPQPPGLVMIAGDADAVRAPAMSAAAWACRVGGMWTDEPPTCPAGSALHLQITFPDCWDGVRLDAPDHRAHVAYGREGHCPDAHPVAMTQLVLVVRYPVDGDPGSLLLASGGLETAHADFVNAWDQAELIAETRHCVNRRVTC